MSTMADEAPPLVKGAMCLDFLQSYIHMKSWIEQKYFIKKYYSLLEDNSELKSQLYQGIKNKCVL